jgi:hypothetical protein
MSDSTAHYYPPGVPERSRRPRTPRLLPLWDAVHHALREKGADLVSFSRRGPYIAEVVFEYAGQYWKLRSEASRSPGWTQETLEDWLYGDLVGDQLKNKLYSINGVMAG